MNTVNSRQCSIKATEARAEARGQSQVPELNWEQRVFHLLTLTLALDSDPI
ncbi:MAG: hypothetical protein ACI9CB_001719 [Rhodothermales bacterium]|jgi:hypothetical protein